MMYNICSVALFDGKYMTSYLMAIVMFALSLTVCDIFANQEYANNFTMKMEIKVK